MTASFACDPAEMTRLKGRNNHRSASIPQPLMAIEQRHSP